jgi:hypothetical protein
MSKINKEQAALLGEVVETRHDIEKAMGVAFGLEASTNLKSELTNVLKNIMRDSVSLDAVNLLRGVKLEAGKFSNLWEKYIPDIDSKEEAIAAKHVLGDKRTSQDWNLFLNDPVIEQALIEEVCLRMMEELAEVGSFMDREQELVDEWKEKRKHIYTFAKGTVDEYTEKVFSPEERKNPKNAPGIDAFKLTRLAAYRILDAHITGNTTFEMTPHLGGAQTVSVRLKSPALEAEGQKDPMLLRQLQYVKLGKVKKVEYDLPEKRKVCGPLLEKMLKETDPRTYRGAPGSFNANHSVQQMAQKICPLLARGSEYFRQKNFDPEAMYDLYSASKELQFLSHSSLYPLLGTGRVPAQMPPDFVERFPKHWRQSNGISLHALAFAGFTPIIHCRMRDIMDNLWKAVPKMKEELSSPETLEHLKLAKTVEVVVKPIKAAAVQREIAVAFKKAYSSDFDQILKSAEAECSEFKADQATYVIKLRNATLDKILGALQKNPKYSVEDLEEQLLKDKRDTGVTFELPPALMWAKDVKSGTPVPERYCTTTEPVR